MERGGTRRKCQEQGEPKVVQTSHYSDSFAQRSFMPLWRVIRSNSCVQPVSPEATVPLPVLVGCCETSAERFHRQENSRWRAGSYPGDEPSNNGLLPEHATWRD